LTHRGHFYIFCPKKDNILNKNNVIIQPPEATLEKCG